MTYQDWLDDVEELSWVRLAARLEDFEDVNFQNLYDEGHSPESVVEYLYEGDDDREEDDY